MSIWRSIGGGPEGHALNRIPDRDSYTGELATDSEMTFAVDVAVAPSWLNCVRFNVDEWNRDGNQTRTVEILLNPAEVTLLIKHLQEAADDIGHNG